MSVFDGLADIFADTFGEAVDYTHDGVTTRISAVWQEVAFDALVDGMNVDVAQTRLHLRAADVSSPKEGDIALRVSDGKTMTVSTPILPDGKGMIVCNLTS